jgi:predicted enzyme related to lactoylglutathione lyase
MTESTATLASTFEFSQKHDIRNQHGAPGWFELATADPKRAKEFLGPLFGWTFEDIEIGGGPYTVIRLEGHEIGGIRGKMLGEDGAPAWTTYVTVDNVDRFAAGARDQGASIAVPPMDLGNAGRMAVIGHPVAGILAAFQYARPFS